MNIVIPENIEILSGEHKRQLQSLGIIQLYESNPKSDDEILKRIRLADIVVIKWTNLSENLINNAIQLKYIITLTVGYNHLPMEVINRKGIKVINCPTHNINAVVEHTIALLMNCPKHIIDSNQQLKSGKWREGPYSYIGKELMEKNLLVIGNGHIGSRVGSIAQALGMVVDLVNSRTTNEELDQLISNADYISLHAPLTDKTYCMFNKRRLNLLKPSAYIINTSRGELIDQEYLYQLLTEKRIAGAALDVYTNEPEDGILPIEIERLVSLSNVIASPHIAWNTQESAQRLGEELIKNLEACLSGNPINMVNN